MNAPLRNCLLRFCFQPCSCHFHRVEACPARNLKRYLQFLNERPSESFLDYEHSEQARAPHTNGLRDVPRCGALSLLQKTRTTRGDDRGAQATVRGGARCASQVLHRCAQAVYRGAARCASQVLDRGAHVDAQGATHVLDRGVQAFTRGTARCAMYVHGRGARADVCGRCFAVLSAQVSTVSLRLRLVVPRPMPAAVASRCC